MPNIQQPEMRRSGRDPLAGAAPGNGPDAVLVGGPREGTTVHSQDVALMTLEIDGLIHRYIRSTARREADGRELVVYNYDGEVRPG